jgi:hypothetical protein
MSKKDLKKTAAPPFTQDAHLVRLSPLRKAPLSNMAWLIISQQVLAGDEEEALSKTLKSRTSEKL